MAQKVDLYSILTSYVAKNNSPFVEIGLFTGYLERTARKNAPEYPEWIKWKDNTRAKFNAELAALAEEGTIELLNDTPDGRIYLPQYFLELIQEYYRSIDANADRPLPCEESLKITIPDNQVRSLGVGSELTTILD